MTTNFFIRAYKKVGFQTAAPGTILFNFHYFLSQVLFYFKRKQKRKDFFLPFLARTKDELNVLVLCGIGDVLWSFVFIPALLKKYDAKKVNLIVHWNGDHRAGRSEALLKRFTFVNKVTRFSWPIHQVPSVDSDGYLIYTYNAFEASGNEKLTFDYSLIVNNYLEKGFSYKDICQILDLDFNLLNLDPFKKYKILQEDLIGINKISQNLNGKSYIVIYFGALSDNTVQGLNYGSLWTEQNWVDLLVQLKKKFKCKFVIVGAQYDISYLNKVISLYKDDFYNDFINTIGQFNFMQTIEIMKKARFVLGFASGVTISSVFLRIKTAIFWRPQNLSMSPQFKKFGFKKEFSDNWVPSDMLKNKNYLPLWYSIDSPKSVVDKIIKFKW